MADDEIITSSANPQLKEIRKLISSSKHRRESQSFVVEGVKFCEMLFHPLQEQFEVRSLLVSESFRDSPEWVALSAASPGIRTVTVSDPLLERLGDVRTSQGVMAVVAMPARKDTLDSSGSGRYLLLDHIMDPGNMGTLIRTAVGAGFDGVLLYGDHVDIYNPKCLRATAGMFPFIPICEIATETIDSFLIAGYRLFAAEADTESTPQTMDFGEKALMAVGNEARGLSDVVRSRATDMLTIPMESPCESYNAAVSGSFLMLYSKLPAIALNKC